MSVEVIHDRFVYEHLIRFYEGSVITAKVFQHRSVPNAEIVVMKQLMRRLRIRVTPEARALLIEDARRWALDSLQDRRAIGQSVLAYLTASVGLTRV